MVSVLRISDGEHNFPFLLKDKILYCPDNNPLAFGNNLKLKFSAYVWDTSIPDHKEVIYEKIFEPKDYEACPLFRYEAVNYRHCISVNINDEGHSGEIIYIELTPWSDESFAENLIGAQGIWYHRSSDLVPITIDIVDRDKRNRYQTKIGFSITPNFEEIAKNCWGWGSESDLTWSGEIAIVDDDDMYWHSANYVLSHGNCVFFDWPNWQFSNFYQFKPNLKLIGVLHMTITTAGHQMNIDIKSEPFPITEEYYTRLISSEQTTIDTTNMKISKPRIINKSIHQVVEMTSLTDSKANIIQPVFFRSRELAQIIVHPQVTENICINLDAYKAQVERFYIKIEGVSFAEIGRTESGVIFKIKGSLLPNTLQTGTYYILNEDADLVTTGKYKYDF